MEKNAEGKVVVTPPETIRVDSYSRRNLVTGPIPDDKCPRVPLVSLTEMQDLLLVENRNKRTAEGETAGIADGGDSHMVRQRPRYARLVSDPPTPEKLVDFFTHLEDCGQIIEACRRARLTYEPVRRLRKDDPDFEILVQEAIERFREMIELEAQRRAVDGWEEPVIGGQHKDRVVATIRKFDSRLMELMLKRHNPAFRDRFEGELKISGGVLVVPATQLSTESWMKQHQGERTQGLPEVVSVQNAPSRALPPPQAPAGQVQRG